VTNDILSDTKNSDTFLLRHLEIYLHLQNIFLSVRLTRSVHFSGASAKAREHRANSSRSLSELLRSLSRARISWVARCV